MSTRNERIAVAAAFAREFITESNLNALGMNSQIPRAAAQLYIAIEQIDGKPCEHGEFYAHAKTGVCVHPECAEVPR